MATTIETIDTMLESVQSEVDDSELVYKLRTARQLLFVLQEQHQLGRNVLEEAHLDEDVMESLRRLGYLD